MGIVTVFVTRGKETMIEPRPLVHEDFAPCMSCGSVQCAVCGERLEEAIAWLKTQRLEIINSLFLCQNCIVLNRVFFRGTFMCYTCLIDEAFLPLLNKEEVKK